MWPPCQGHSENERRARPRRCTRLQCFNQSMYVCRNHMRALTTRANECATSPGCSGTRRRFQSQHRARGWPAAARQNTFERCHKGRRTSPRSYVWPIHMADSSPWKLLMTVVDTMFVHVSSDMELIDSATAAVSGVGIDSEIGVVGETGAHEERFHWVLHKRPSGPPAWTGPTRSHPGRFLNAYTVVFNQRPSAYLDT